MHIKHSSNMFEKHIVGGTSRSSHIISVNLLFDSHMWAGHPEVGKHGSRLPEAESCHEAEWVERHEPGVYVTLTTLPGGARDLKRVRFRYILLILCMNQLLFGSAFHSWFV